MSVLRFFVLAALASVSTASNPHHPEFDYCDWLGQDDVQGLKHGFLAGNNVYYIGGRLAHDEMHETLGLTHPFFHDLRSRGTGIVYHEVHTS